MKILVIGEKTSQVKTFATSLCGSYSSTKLAKYIYAYRGTWRHPGGKVLSFTFIPLAGHITELKTRDGYNWNQCKPLDLVTDEKALYFVNRAPYVKILRDNIKGMDELWLATDPDSEGQNIAYEALTILSTHVKKMTVRRIWNSSLTQKEIIRAFTQPREWDESLALAVQGRRLADAWLGFAGTRELTTAARQVAQVKVLSVGRVQLPTLRLVVHRDFVIESHNPKDRWKVNAVVSKNQESFLMEHELGFIHDKDKAASIRKSLAAIKTAKVIEIQSKLQKTKPPIPLNTTAAVSLLSRLLKVNAKKALDLMVELYNKGLLSYPRTENALFSDGFPHAEILGKLRLLEYYKGHIDGVRSTSQVRNNGKRKEAEDHDPIHPTGELKGLSSLPTDQFKAWDILTRYYISLFMDDRESELTKVICMIGTEKFVANGVIVLNPGWTSIHFWHKSKEVILPPLKEGDELEVLKVSTALSKTKPPPRWNDSKILIEMERLKIGTKSSRPEILNKLISRKYLIRKGRGLVSTNWGRVMIASLEPIWPEIVSPIYTRHVEDMMDSVANKEQSYESMLRKLRDEYIEHHKKLLINIKIYQELLLKLNLKKQSDASTSVDATTNEILMKLISPEDHTDLSGLNDEIG